MTPKRAKRKLKEVQKIDLSISKIQRIWTTSAVTVQTHSGHCGYSDEGKKRVIMLVCGSSQLQKDGTRANRHSPQAAVNVYNEEEKGNLNMTKVRTWLHKAGLNWRVGQKGPGVTEVNCVARLAFRERHQHQTAIFWQELVWTDSTTLGHDHRCNQHNDGIWVEKGEAVPTLQKL